VDDYIYQMDFHSRAEANAAGFSLTIPIYGVPVTAGADFSDSNREQWRHDYESKHSSRTSSTSNYSSLLKQADPNIVNAWLACATLPSGDQGLTAGLKASGKDYVYFWIRYDQRVTNAPAPVIASIQTTGVDASSQPIKVGAIIPAEASGLGALYRVTDPSNVTILVVAGDAADPKTPRGTVAPHLDFTAARTQPLGNFVSAGPIVGEIRAIAFGGDRTSTQIANLRKQGWLECAGQALNVLEYPELYVAIREGWGTPAQGVAFNVPDLSGEFLRGWNHATKIATPDAKIHPAGDFDSNSVQKPSNPGDPSVTTRISSQQGGSTGDAVGSFQDAHLAGFPNTTGPFKKINNNTDPPSCCAYYVAANPQAGWYFDNITTNRNPDGMDIAPKNVYVMYIIYVGRPVLDTTP
jgi:hypothetical protein